MKCAIIYSSMTGNTKLLADGVYRQLDELVPIYTVKDKIDLDAYDTLCLGYWIKKGGCDKATKKLWDNIHDKKIVLFGTMGVNPDSEVGQQQVEKIERLLADRNQILGHFVCSGKMEAEQLALCKEKIAASLDNPPAIQAQLDNADYAANHPDKMDILELQRLIHEVLKR